MTTARSKIRPTTVLARSQALLDSLPDGSVVIDAFGHAWQLGNLYWYRAFGDDTSVSSSQARAYGPFTVAHLGEGRRFYA